MAEKLYIYGCGGHAKVVAATARLVGYEIAGFWEDSGERVGMDFFGSKVIDFEDVPQGAEIFVAFGNNQVRLEKGLKLKENYRISTLIHPSAQISEGVKIGVGTYIGALANIDPDCKIGEFCIVNNGANISHETILHDGCHVCGGSQTAGQCSIGRCSMLGIGSCVIEKRSIGANSCIGAGAAVIHDLPDNITAVGTPAEIIKRHQTSFSVSNNDVERTEE